MDRCRRVPVAHSCAIGTTVDLIILDPPKFAPTPQPRIWRGFKDINLLAFKLLRPGGLLATFCSGGVSAELFLDRRRAALNAGADAQMIGQFHAAPDHRCRSPSRRQII